MIKKRFRTRFLLSVLAILWGITASNGAFATPEASSQDSFAEFIASVETEALNEDTEYKLYDSVRPFETGRDSAQGYISRFDISDDGRTVALGFTDGSRSSVAVFSLVNESLKLEYGFDIALSEAFELRLVAEGLAVWLIESNATFAYAPDKGIVESKKLIFDAENSEDAVKPPISEKSELFFKRGATRKNTPSGDDFFLDASVGDGDKTQFSRLVRISADGSETVLYEALAVDKLGGAVTVTIGVLSVILAASTVGAVLFERIKRKKL